jgi:hypothetical protein
MPADSVSGEGHFLLNGSLLAVFLHDGRGEEYLFQSEDFGI